MYILAAAPDFPSLRWGVDLFLSNFLGIETNFFKYMTYICIHSCEICILWGGGLFMLQWESLSSVRNLTCCFVSLVRFLTI